VGKIVKEVPRKRQEQFLQVTCVRCLSWYAKNTAKVQSESEPFVAVASFGHTG
jgi:hypothetical protein